MNFNGTDLTSLLNIKEISGRSLVGYNLGLTDSSYQDGAYYRKKKTRPPRSLRITYQVIGRNREEIRDNIDELNKIFDVQEAAPIIFPDEPSKTYYGLPQENQEGSESFFLHEGTFTIICPNPDKFGAPIKKTINNDTSIYYEGTAKTRPILNVTFSESASFYEVENQEGLKVKVNYDFQAGDELELNFQTQKITINGELQMTSLAWSVSDWFFIEPGYNTIQSSHEALMKYTKKWK